MQRIVILHHHAPYNTSLTASPIISHLPDTNKVLSRTQRFRKPPLFFGEPIPFDLVHKLKRKYETSNLLLILSFLFKASPRTKTMKILTLRIYKYTKSAN